MIKKENLKKVNFKKTLKEVRDIMQTEDKGRVLFLVQGTKYAVWGWMSHPSVKPTKMSR